MYFPLMNHTRAMACAVGLLASLAPSISPAQTYPTKTIRMIVPFAAGGNTDIIARIVAPEMGKLFGQQIIIDNRGGAGSIIGTEIAARSPADGYTLITVSAAHVINPAMIKKLPYDSIKDFTAISMIGFLWLYWRAGSPTPLRTIALVDLIGMPFLAYALWGAFRPS